MSLPRRIGVALGSGSARGWAHIGVLRELHALGIEPQIVCGTSTGALVAAAYVMEKLDLLESWVRGMNTRNVVKYFDIRLVVGGGFVEGKWLMEFLRSRLGDAMIEQLPKPFGAVATDLRTGREVWLRSGPIWDAVRASIALPGFITPVRMGDEWLVDGGLVNPVPVSLCRAMGADWIVAVNLNGDIVGRHFNDLRSSSATPRQASTEKRLLKKLTIGLKERVKTGTPGLFDVLAGSINIMQDRITIGRLSDHPPDVLIAPRLAHIGLLEFDRAAEAIEEGRQAVRRAPRELNTVGEQSISSISTKEGIV